MSGINKQMVNEAAYIFAMEDLCSTASGNYDSFLDFLITETDQRSVLPHYFACLFNDDASRAMLNLKSFLYQVLHDESKMYLLKGYAKDIKKILDGNDEVQKVFKMFELIQTLKGDERETALDKLMDE